MSRPELGDDLFAVGDPDFAIDDYLAWISERKGEAFATRLKKKMGDNVLFALGATVQAMQCSDKLEKIAKELDEACHVYVGSGVGDLPQSYAAARSIDAATRVWNQFWADPVRCEARRVYEETGTLESSSAAPGTEPPTDPKTLPVDSEERLEARLEWDAFWSARSSKRSEFMTRMQAVELGVAEESPPASDRPENPARRDAPVQPKGAAGSTDKAQLDAIRRRLRPPPRSPRRRRPAAPTSPASPTRTTASA